jgi:predicted PurR-regulated permease PerM
MPEAPPPHRPSPAPAPLAAAAAKLDHAAVHLDGAAAKAQAAASARDPRRLHLFQIQWVRDIAVVLLIYAVLHLGYILSPITVPVLLALTLAYLVEPLVKRRPRWVSRQGAAVAIILAIVLVVTVPLALGIGFAVSQGLDAASKVQRNLSLLVDTLPKADTTSPDKPGETASPAPDSGAPATPDGSTPEDQLATKLPVPWQNLRNWVIDHKIQAAVAEYADGIRKAVVSPKAFVTGVDVLRVGWRVLLSSLLLVFSLFLTLFFFYFFSTGWQRVQDSIAAFIPEWKKTRALTLLSQMDRVIAGFVRGRITIMLILMALYTIGYFFIGVPAAMIVGPAVGLLAVAPYLGLVGIPTTMLLLWLQPATHFAWQTQWWWIVFAPMIVYFAVQWTDDYFLTPLIQGKTTQMDTPTILFAVFAGAILAGFYGLLIAIPVAACIKILLREIFWPRFKAWAEGRAKDFLPVAAEETSTDPSPGARRAQSE